MPAPRPLAILGALGLACAGDPSASTPGTGSTGETPSTTGVGVDPSTSDPDSTGVTSSGAADSTGTVIEPPALATVHPSIVDPLGAVAPGTGLDVVVERAGSVATLAGAVDAWSPAELPGARVFDAATA
jgi:hypothetical protein